MRWFIAQTSAVTIAFGLLTATPAGAIPVVNDVEIELYHVFPVDSDPTRTPNVLTRVNSPSDNNFLAADGALGQLTFTTTVLNPSFTVANSVFNNINPAKSIYRRPRPDDGCGSGVRREVHPGLSADTGGSYIFPSRGRFWERG